MRNRRASVCGGRVVLGCLSLIASFVGPPGMAARGDEAAAAASRPAPEPGVTRLTIAAAPTTRPALRYRFLPDSAEQEPGNAALLYLAAARAEPPAAATQPAEELERLDKYLNETPLDQLPGSGAAKLLEGRTVLKLLERAARCDECRWETLPRDAGADGLLKIMLPQLHDARVLALWLALEARLEIAEGRFDDAARSLQAGFALARNLSSRALFLRGMVAAGVESLMLKRVEEWVQAPGSPNLYWALSDLPQPFLDLREIGRQERLWDGFTLPQFRQAMRGELPPDEWPALWDRFVVTVASTNGHGSPSGAELAQTRVFLGVQAAPLYPEAKGWMIAAGVPAAKVEELPPLYVSGTYLYVKMEAGWDDVWKWWDLPYPAAAEGMMREEAGAKADLVGVWARLAAPSIRRTRLTLEKPDRSLQVMRVVEAVRSYAAAHDGRPPATLADAGLPVSDDPLTGRPFGYEVRDQTAVIVAVTPPGGGRGDALRYEVTVRR